MLHRTPEFAVHSLCMGHLGAIGGGLRETIDRDASGAQCLYTDPVRIAGYLNAAFVAGVAVAPAIRSSGRRRTDLLSESL